MLIERSKRGRVRHAESIYGTTVEGRPLTVYLPENRHPEILVMASIHGDESETTVVLSDAIRTVSPSALRNAVILCANPDGMLKGTRGNANGVDLNRNFPTENWSPEPVFHKSRAGEPQDIELSPGTAPASEPETRALLKLLERLQPKAVVTLHAALECVDDADASVLGRCLADKSGLPLLPDVGYSTPGSLGSWASERKLNLVTYEFEAASPYQTKERHAPVMIDLVTGDVVLA